MEICTYILHDIFKMNEHATKFNSLKKLFINRNYTNLEFVFLFLILIFEFNHNRIRFHSPYSPSRSDSRSQSQFQFQSKSLVEIFLPSLRCLIWNHRWWVWAQGERQRVHGLKTRSHIASAAWLGMVRITACLGDSNCMIPALSESSLSLLAAWIDSADCEVAVIISIIIIIINEYWEW